MVDNRASLEIIAPSVEEAIEQGLGDLGLPRESVDVEVLDEGSKGLFGLGTRQARVRLTIKPSPGANPDGEAPVEASLHPSDDVQNNEPEVKPFSPLADEQYVLSVAQSVVSELLEKMKVRAM
jgi:spoIIIJ-associated protein